MNHLDDDLFNIRRKLNQPAESGTLKDKVNDLSYLVYGALAVLLTLVISLLFGLVAMHNDYLAMKTVTYQNLVDKVDDNNDEMKILVNEVKILRAVTEGKQAEIQKATFSNCFDKQ